MTLEPVKPFEGDGRASSCYCFGGGLLKWLESAKDTEAI
jgi:hypothetical protein